MNLNNIVQLYLKSFKDVLIEFKQGKRYIFVFLFSTIAYSLIFGGFFANYGTGCDKQDIHTLYSEGRIPSMSEAMLKRYDRIEQDKSDMMLAVIEANRQLGCVARFDKDFDTIRTSTGSIMGITSVPEIPGVMEDSYQYFFPINLPKLDYSNSLTFLKLLTGFILGLLLSAPLKSI